MIQRIIEDVRNGLLNKCFYISLFTALAIPDICVATEYGNTSGKKYSKWWNENMPDYTGYLSGDDCYALRCAILYQGKGGIQEQRMQKIIEYFIFIAKGGHCNLFQNVTLHGKNQSFLQLNVERFCEDICCAAEKWTQEKSSDQILTKRIQEGIMIHDSDYSHLKLIKFS